MQSRKYGEENDHSANSLETWLLLVNDLIRPVTYNIFAPPPRLPMSLQSSKSVGDWLLKHSSTLANVILLRPWFSTSDLKLGYVLGTSLRYNSSSQYHVIAIDLKQAVQS